MNNLSVKIASLSLKGPGMVASGIMDETGDSMIRMLRSGAAAVVTKSIGTEPNPGHGNPSFLDVGVGYVNAMGLPNPGIEAFADEMASAVKEGPIIGSVYAKSAEEFASLSSKMEEYGASAIELNLSCPHAKGYGMEMGTDPEIVNIIVKTVKDSVNIPVFAKLTPNTHRLTEIGKAVENAGGDAVVAINTLKAMVISPEAGKPVLSNRFGGLSGPAVKPVGVRAVFDLYASLGIPVIGVGGICSWRDAAEYIMAGASAFQIGGAVGSDINIFKNVEDGLSGFMEKFGYDSIGHMVGVAHE